MVSLNFKYVVLVAAIFALLCISVGKCQDDDEEEDEYDEENADLEPTPAPSTTRKYRVRPSTTIDPPPSGRNESVSGNATGAVPQSSVAATTLASAPAGTPPPLPPTPSPDRVRATTLSESQEEEATEEEGIGFVFRPLTTLIDNIVAGNVTGIVDNALSIRTPPEVRSFVNSIMSNVFGSGFGGALRQFTPRLFSTTKAPTTGRDIIPIPTHATAVLSTAHISGPASIPFDTAIIEARANNTEETATNKKRKPAPIQLKLAHPGAPASRLRCEVVME